MDWLEQLIRTHLEWDIPQMGFRVPANRLRRLWTMLAHLQNVSYGLLGDFFLLCHLRSSSELR
jgi:predicted AAA+ superfamily ATPase